MEASVGRQKEKKYNNKRKDETVVNWNLTIKNPSKKPSGYLAKWMRNEVEQENSFTVSTKLENI